MSRNVQIFCNTAAYDAEEKVEQWGVMPDYMLLMPGVYPTKVTGNNNEK